MTERFLRGTDLHDRQVRASTANRESLPRMIRVVPLPVATASTQQGSSMRKNGVARHKDCTILNRRVGDLPTYLSVVFVFDNLYLSL